MMKRYTSPFTIKAHFVAAAADDDDDDDDDDASAVSPNQTDDHLLVNNIKSHLKRF